MNIGVLNLGSKKVLLRTQRRVRKEVDGQALRLYLIETGVIKPANK